MGLLWTWRSCSQVSRSWEEGVEREAPKTFRLSLGPFCRGGRSGHTREGACGPAASGASDRAAAGGVEAGDSGAAQEEPVGEGGCWAGEVWELRWGGAGVLKAGWKERI